MSSVEYSIASTWFYMEAASEMGTLGAGRRRHQAVLLRPGAIRVVLPG
jgi:hypothetical protein